jgi:hypothetical protein
LFKPAARLLEKVPAWILVFDIEAAPIPSPNSITLQDIIATDAESFAYFATHVAPEAAIAEHGAAIAVRGAIGRRLRDFWPELDVEVASLT